MKELFEKIRDHILSQDVQSTFTTAGVSPIRVVDLDRNQLKASDQSDILLLPALLLHFSTKWMQTPYNGETTVEATLVYENFGIAANWANDASALDSLRLSEMVQAELIDIETENTGKLQLVDTRMQDTDSLIAHFVFTFRCQMYLEPIDTTRYTGENLDADISFGSDTGFVSHSK